MKKYMRRIVSIMFLLVYCIMGSSIFIAKESSGLYIATKACPQAYIDYVEDNISQFILGTGDEVPPSRISVGTPFSFAQSDADIFYFPILCSDKITYLLRVYPDGVGGYSGVISSFLAAELDSLSPLSSIEEPVQLVLEGSSIVAYVGNASHTLFTYPKGGVVESKPQESAAMRNSYVAVNAKKTSPISVNVDQSRSNQYKFIAIDLSESMPQNGNSWCGAYCAAAILRSVGTATPMGHPTAEDVLSIIYPNGYTTASTTTPVQLIAAAHEYEVYPIYANYVMSTNFLINQLNDVWPIFMQMRDYTFNQDHAVVLRGYDLRSSVWSIWNPWYNDHFESFPIGGTYSPAINSAYNYSYVATIHNWMCE